MKKRVTELTEGDLIDPPAGEKVWLWRDGIKRRYSVVSVEAGKVTAKGGFVRIMATVPSPYGNEQPSNIDCYMLETKLVMVHN